MRARQIAEKFPLVQPSDEALSIARLLAKRRLPGVVVVVDEDGAPVTVLPGSQVLCFPVPGYVQEDPSLARVFDERSADACATKLAGWRVRDLCGFAVLEGGPEVRPRHSGLPTAGELPEPSPEGVPAPGVKHSCRHGTSELNCPLWTDRRRSWNARRGWPDCAARSSPWSIRGGCSV